MFVTPSMTYLIYKLVNAEITEKSSFGNFETRKIKNYVKWMLSIMEEGNGLVAITSNIICDHLSESAVAYGMPDFASYEN